MGTLVLTFLARTRNDLLEQQIALSVSLVEWTYCAHSIVLSFYLQMGPRLWDFCVFSEPETCPHPDHLRKYIIYFWKVHWSGKVWLGWIHSWCNFRGSLETSVWSTQHAREWYIFILNWLWLSLRDAMHCMTQHGIRTHNWISFGDWIQLYSRFSTHLLPLSTSHEFEPLTLSCSILATLVVLFACIIHDFTTLDFANFAMTLQPWILPILHAMKVQRPKLGVQITT